MTLAEIAKLAGVSKATVSSVLNGKAEKYRISADTQARVMAIVERNGYQPNHSAAALRRGSSRSIGFIVPDFENRSYLRIAKRLEALARAAGYQLIISSSDDDRETEQQAARVLVARGVDALLVSSCLEGEVSLYKEILQRGVPVIALDRPLPSPFCNVISDDRQGAFELTRSLRLDGVGRAVLLGALPSLQVSQAREQGFREALADYPDIVAECHYGPHFDADTGSALLRALAESAEGLPDAIVTTSFSLLEGVIEALRNDLQNPLPSLENYPQLATFGNGRLLDFIRLPVNSLPQQYDAIAEAAWGLARQAMEGDYPDRQVIIARTLRARTSVAG
ncbi:substrate-binding domain-containing protein [Mangrovitalea sediminis]|uniref:substrate-binding domain-containing protein n=1 Tax=Mangrovitalea sediminis TaxID=1982043 RepID=UPI000BE5EB29|nr:LacI family DNA-binding transcriptional regulator [Mangrovitalea sediminis]